MKGLKYLVIAGLLLGLQAEARMYKKAAQKAAPTYSVEAMAIQETAAPAAAIPAGSLETCCPSCTPFITQTKDVCRKCTYRPKVCIPTRSTITRECMFEVEAENTCCEMVNGEVCAPSCAPCCPPNCCKPCCKPVCAPCAPRCRTCR